MNAVIYARYSPGPRQTDQSIEGQVRDCMAYAKENGIKVLDVYADRHISGSDFENRKEFNRMLRDASKKQFESIIVWKIDRFGRDREEIALNKIKLRRNGIRLLYAREVIPDGPEGIILESLMEGLAEYYIADLRQKVKRGHRENALKGLVVGGRAPYGYKIVDKTYQVEEKESWVVRYAFENYDAGCTAVEILKNLEKMGVKNRNGSLITKNGIYTMLRNEKYIGKHCYEGIPVPIPAIISQELWDSVHAKFHKRVGRASSYKADEKYLLSLKAFCGECGSLLVGECGYGKTGKRYSYYKCATRKRKNSPERCSLKTYRKDELEDFVVYHTVNDVLQNDIIEYLADRVIEIQANDSSSLRIEQLNSSLKESQKSIKNIMSAIEQGIITPTTKERLMELEAQAEDLKTHIAREEIKKPSITREHVVYWLKMFKNGDVSDPTFKLRLMDVFVHSVYVYNEKVVIAYNYTSNNHSVDFDPEIFRCSNEHQLVRERGLYPNFSVCVKHSIFKYVVAL